MLVSTPKNPMVLLIIIPFLNGYFIGGLDPIFRHTRMTSDQKARQFLYEDNLEAEVNGYFQPTLRSPGRFLPLR